MNALTVMYPMQLLLEVKLIVPSDGKRVLLLHEAFPTKPYK